MKTRSYFSQEEFEKKNPYVIVEAPHYDGRKCAFAQITGGYTNKKTAEKVVEETGGGRVMTRKQAIKFVQQWNEEYEAGNLRINL
jgi:hypothetical protein